MHALIAAPPIASARAVPRVPVPLDELFSIAYAMLQHERLADAESLLNHIVSACPEAASALHLKGVVLFRTNRPEAAASLIERAIELAPDVLEFRRNICPVYERLGRYEDAIRIGYEVLDYDPYDLQTLHNLALVHYRKLELDQSSACSRRALALNPRAPGPHFQLAETLLLRGEFTEGWQEYEWRYRIAGAAPPLPPTDHPQWNGESMSGRLLLIADQGFGDAIQFSRYIPWASERCPDLIVAADVSLQPLIGQIAPVKLVSRWELCPPFAAYCPLSGLPRLHGTVLDNVPNKVPYLHADPARVSVWRERLRDLTPSGVRRIGIAWAGRPIHNNDLNRSAGLAAFAPLAKMEGIVLISLQKGAAQRAISTYFDQAPLLNIGSMVSGFADTMAIIESLDLVVTVDTAVAHLAGAMAKPVWILLPYAPDWRWLLNRDDSPWYPTARLFRQPLAGEWGPVGMAVRDALRC
jgi:hypothetical protein